MSSWAEIRNGAPATDHTDTCSALPGPGRTVTGQEQVTPHRQTPSYKLTPVAHSGVKNDTNSQPLPQQVHPFLTAHRWPAFSPSDHRPKGWDMIIPECPKPLPSTTELKNLQIHAQFFHCSEDVSLTRQSHAHWTS